MSTFRQFLTLTSSPAFERLNSHLLAPSIPRQTTNMASPSLPTPPSSPQPSLTSSRLPLTHANPAPTQGYPSASIEHLDALLESYLQLLHQYTTLQTQLSQHFSDGFFALARGNH